MQKVTRGLQIVASLGNLMQMKTISKSTFVTLILQKGSRVLQIWTYNLTSRKQIQI